VDEIVGHPFLASIDFNQLLNKSLHPPFKPILSDDIYDVSNFDQQFTSEEAINSVIPQSKMD